MGGGADLRIVLHGCRGKMGQVMIRVAAEAEDVSVIYGVDSMSGPEEGFPVAGTLDEVPSLESHVLVDFSRASALSGILDYGVKRGIPLVICTTGFGPQDVALMREAGRSIPVLHSSNMSLGANLVAELAAQAALFLGDAFDIEIIERHHKEKVDAPSGTALTIANTISHAVGERGYVYGRHPGSQKRVPGDIGIHALRGGTITGRHTVVFAGPDEVVEIRHEALGRVVFARGALQAVRFLMGQGPGYYSMADVVRGG